MMRTCVLPTSQSRARRHEAAGGRHQGGRTIPIRARAGAHPGLASSHGSSKEGRRCGSWQGEVAKEKLRSAAGENGFPLNSVNSSSFN